MDTMGLYSGESSLLPALVGREVELAVLAELLGHARSGHAQVVSVEGEAGMGKSALLDAFVVTHQEDVAVLRARCDEFEQSRAYRLAGVLLADEGSTLSDVTAGRRLLALLGDLQAKYERVVMVVVDDAQWIDRPSARALRFALRRLRADRVMCVVARRPHTDPLGFDVTKDPSATTAVRLRPLDANDVRELALRLRGWDLPIDLAQRLVARTGGVPLLVAAVVGSVADESGLEAGSPLPASAATEARRMLASVDTDARRLVEAAAVLADPTDLVVLGRIADLAEPATAATTAEAAGLIASDDASRITCSHALLAAAVYDSLPITRRRDLHAAAATWTTGSRRLAHRTAAADRPDPQLVVDLVDAAAHERSSLNYGVAADHLLRARTVSDDPDQRDRLVQAALIERVEALDLGGAEELAPLAREGPRSSTQKLALGLLARETGQVGPAVTMLQDAIELADAAGDEETRARAALAVAVLHVRMGAGELAVETLDDTGRLEDPELASDAVTTRAIGLWQVGKLDRALALLAGPLSSAGTGWEADRVAARGLLLMSAGRVPEALADLDAAVRIAHVWRPSANQSRTYCLRSMARFVTGDWDGALVDAAAARAFAQAAAQPWSASLALAVSADVPALRGHWDVAAEHLGRARDALPETPGPSMADHLLSHEVVFNAVREEHLAVLDALAPVWSEDYLHRLARIRDLRTVMHARVRADIAVGRLTDAEHDLATYVELLRRYPGGSVPHRLGWLRGLLAEAHGDPRSAQHHYATDLTDPQSADAPAVRAELLLTSGRLERVLGNRREAVDRLSQAQDIFARLQAAPGARRTAAELVACGLHSPVADPLALTPRERDVAALVSRGYTNKEVAAELFVTAKTVEYHLRNTYAKLGVTSRVELRRRLDPELR